MIAGTCTLGGGLFEESEPKVNVSVVIPCYNAARYIGETVEACRRQTHAPCEIIVVDDGSRDGSAAIADAAGARVVTEPANLGPSASRNAGIRSATGELIAFVDADDRWQREHLAIAVTMFQRFPIAGVVFSERRYFGAQECETVSRVPPESPLDLRRLLLAENMICQSGAVVRRHLLLQVGGYDESRRRAEDFELWLRLSMLTRFVATGSATVEYRVHPDQASAVPGPMYEGAWTARADHLRRIGDSLSQAERLDLESQLRLLWIADLENAWRQRTRSTLDAVLQLAPLVPGSADIARRWQRRALLHPAWRGAAWLYDQSPQWMRDAVRRGHG